MIMEATKESVIERLNKLKSLFDYDENKSLLYNQLNSHLLEQIVVKAFLQSGYIKPTKTELSKLKKK